jgi:lauroyl/myristoyl acyltransferase
MRQLFRFYYYCSYLVFRLCEGAVRLLPLDVAFVVGQGAGEIAYHILPKRRALALNNLRLAFGREKSDAELRQLNRKHFQTLGANLLSGLKCSTMPHDKIWERVEAEVPYESGPGWIALLSHLGNWEIFSHLGGRYPEYRYGAIYQSLSNPFVDAYLVEQRKRSGITLFDRRRDMLRCVRFVREGGVLGLLVDQGAGYAGVWMPLFGRLTSSSTFAAMLAIRTGLPFLPLSIETCGRARWRMRIGKAILPGDDDPELLTARINQELEDAIRSSPADWLWAHNRWKALRPHVLFALDRRRVFLPPGYDAASLDPYRILIVSPDSPENAAAAQPAARAIKRGRPDTWVAVLAQAATTSEWHNGGAVDHVIEWTEDDSFLTLARKIRDAARFNVAIFFEPSWKTATAVRLADVGLRVGRRGGLISKLYNQHPKRPTLAANASEAYLEIAQSIGAEINHPDVPLRQNSVAPASAA